MLEITIKVSGSNFSPENDRHEPEPVVIEHVFNFKQPDNAINGPTVNSQADIALQIATFVRNTIKQ